MLEYGFDGIQYPPVPRNWASRHEKDCEQHLLKESVGTEVEAQQQGSPEDLLVSAWRAARQDSK